MRLAILSDIHGNLPALETALTDLGTRGVDATINLGDCVSSPLWPRETLELLDTLGWPTVRGNHDRWLVEERPKGMTPTIAFARDALTPAQRMQLHALPATLALEDDVFAVHGRVDGDTEYLLEDDVDGRLAMASGSALADRLTDVSATLVLCGHSHLQHSAGVGGRLVVNPGSVGMPRYADGDDSRIAEASSPHARYAIATRVGARWSVEMVALAYDWDVVAQRAIANGRPDFGEAFVA